MRLAATTLSLGSRNFVLNILVQYNALKFYKILVCSCTANILSHDR